MNLLDHADDIASEFRGNWMKFDSFGWHDQPDDAENWGHWGIDSRDSEILTQSNATAIRAELEPFMGGEDADCCDESHRHWAVGHMGVITCRVYRKGYETLVKPVKPVLPKTKTRRARKLAIVKHGHLMAAYDKAMAKYEVMEAVRFTSAFLKIVELMLSLEDYPCLDENDYSARQYEETLARIEDCCPSNDWPEDYTKQLFGWLWDNDQMALEDQGERLTREQVITAAKALGWKVDETDY